MRAFETEKTEVAEIDRSVYDIKDKVNAAFEVNLARRQRSWSRSLKKSTIPTGCVNSA